MTIILRIKTGEMTLTRVTAPEVLIVGRQFFLRMSVQEGRAIYQPTAPEEL